VIKEKNSIQRREKFKEKIKESWAALDEE